MTQPAAVGPAEAGSVARRHRRPSSTSSRIETPPPKGCPARLCRMRSASARPGPVRSGPGGHQPGDLFTTARDDDLLAARGAFDEFGQAILGLEDADGGHGGLGSTVEG